MDCQAQMSPHQNGRVDSSTSRRLQKTKFFMQVSPLLIVVISRALFTDWCLGFLFMAFGVKVRYSSSGSSQKVEPLTTIQRVSLSPRGTGSFAIVHFIWLQPCQQDPYTRRNVSWKLASKFAKDRCNNWHGSESFSFWSYWQQETLLSVKVDLMYWHGWLEIQKNGSPDCVTGAYRFPKSC